MTTTQEEQLFISLFNNLFETCEKNNIEDLTYLSNEHNFKKLILEIEPKIEEIVGPIEIAKDAAFGVRYGNYVAILKSIEDYLNKHADRDKFTTVNLQSFIIINDILKNSKEQLCLLADILLFLSSISSKKNDYLDKVSELDEDICSLFFSSIEKYIYIDSEAINQSRTNIFDKSNHYHNKHYEKEKNFYIVIIKEYEATILKQKEQIESLEKANRISETKFNDQLRENHLLARNQNKTDAIHEQLINNSLTNNELNNKIHFKDLEIADLKKELELHQKRSIQDLTKFQEQLEIKNEQLKDFKELEVKYEKMNQRYKETKNTLDTKAGKSKGMSITVEERNSTIDQLTKDKTILLQQIDKLNKDIQQEQKLKADLEFEKKEMIFEINDLKKELTSQQLKINTDFFSKNEQSFNNGITIEGILNETANDNNFKILPSPINNTPQINSLNDEIIRLKEECTELQGKIDDLRQKNCLLRTDKEKKDIQIQKHELEIQKLNLLIDRIKNESKRFEDDNKCLDEKIKEMNKSKKNEIDLIKKDLNSKTALIETMLDEKKNFITDYQKLQKEFENYKQTVHSPAPSSLNSGEKKNTKNQVQNSQVQIQQQQALVSNSEILSLKNEIQNLKLASIQKDNEIQMLKEHNATVLTEEEINIKLADLDFYKKSYEEQKNRVNREHELISDSLHKLAIHFMSLKDDLQKKMKK